jgi:hypothetical protein
LRFVRAVGSELTLNGPSQRRYDDVFFLVFDLRYGLFSRPSIRRLFSRRYGGQRRQ